MTTTRLRGIFDDLGAATEAASSLRARGLSDVMVRYEGREGPSARSAPAGGTRKILAFGVLVGAGLGLVLGLAWGLPSLAMPSVREDTGSIVLTIMLWALGPALLGGIAGGVWGALASSAFRNKAGAPAAGAAPGAAAGPTRVIVTVPVGDEAAAEEARRMLYELRASAVEAQPDEARA